MRVALFIILSLCYYVRNIATDNLETCFAFCDTLPTFQQAECKERCIERYGAELDKCSTLKEFYAVCNEKLKRHKRYCQNICKKAIEKLKGKVSAQSKGKAKLEIEMPLISATTEDSNSKKI